MDNDVKITSICLFKSVFLCSGSNVGILFSDNGKIWEQTELEEGDFRIGKVDEYTDNIICAIRISDDKKFYSLNGKSWIPEEELTWDITIKDPDSILGFGENYKPFKERVRNFFSKRVG